MTLWFLGIPCCMTTTSRPKKGRDTENKRRIMRRQYFCRITMHKYMYTANLWDFLGPEPNIPLDSFFIIRYYERKFKCFDKINPRWVGDLFL